MVGISYSIVIHQNQRNFRKNIAFFYKLEMMAIIMKAKDLIMMVIKIIMFIITNILSCFFIAIIYFREESQTAC